MSFKKILTWAVVLGMLVVLFATMPSATQAQSGNLLQSPGLNLPYDNGKQPAGWGRWFQLIDKPGDASALQYAIAPNFSAETNPSGKFPQLILEGNASQHIGRQFDPWIGGVYQTVPNIPPGAQVRFCAYSRLYAQNADYGKGPSVTGMNGRSQVGVFLNGDALWDNPGIVWSGQANPHDTWQNICITAGPVGPAGKVTVFTRNDWRGSGAIHLDAWWDQAELVTLGDQPTATPQAQQPQQPQPTAQQPQVQVATPDATGTVVHTVAAGDTLFALSFQYDVPLDQIYQLNGLNSQSILSIGQKIIIKGKASATAAQPTAAPQPTSAPTQAGTPPTPDATAAAATPAAQQPTAAPTEVAANTASQLCVFAFEDANGDGLRDTGENAVPGVVFDVIDSQGTNTAEYTSTDSSEAHCFTDLMPGQYKVNVKPAPSTVATSDKLWNVSLTSGSTVDVNFGSRSSEGSSSVPSSSTGSTSSTSGGSSIGGLLGGVIGLVLLLAAGVIGAFVIARRRA